MELDGSWFAKVLPYLPSAVTTGLVVVVLFVARLLLEKEKIDAQDIRSVLGPVAPSVKAIENVSTTRNVA